MLTDKMISFVIVIKLMPCRNLLQNWHRRSGFQDLILLVKALRDIAVLIFTRIAFQINVAKNLIEFLAFSSVLT